MGTSVSDGLRNLQASVTSGITWLVAIWLWIGDRIVGVVNAPKASGTALLIRQASLALGSGGLLVLAIVALIVGTLSNLVIASVLALWGVDNAVDIIMEWPDSRELRSAAPQEHWSIARRLRGEGLTSVSFAPPALAIIITLSVNLSAWWLVALPVLALVIVHGILALQRYLAMWRQLTAD